MTSLSITEHSRLADRIMGAYFRLSVEEGTFREDTAPDFSRDTLALCGLFGMTPVKLHYAGADRRLQCEAFIVNDPADRRIYLTNHARSPERALIGHELVHRMRRERPELYDDLVDELASAGVNEARWAVFYHALREQTLRKEGRALSDAEIREEGVADLVGDLILDPQVWRTLQRPSLLERISAWIASVWQRLRGAQAHADPLGGAGLVHDRERAMAVVSRVLDEWSASLARPSPAAATSLASAAALRRDPDAPEGAFRSALLDALVAGKGAPARAPWQQWLGWLDGAQRRGEIKQGERAWLGLDDWLGQQKGPIPRQALVDYVRKHQVQILEVVLGDELSGQLPSGWTLQQDRYGNWLVHNERNSPVTTPQRLREHALEAMPRCEKPTKFSEWQLPGGESYRELLLTLPDSGNADPSDEQIAAYLPIATWEAAGRSRARVPVAAWAEARRDYLQDNEVAQIGAQFHSGHFDQPNILAHVRFNERTDADGRRVLFIEEIQSDWHQQGRTKGYGLPDDFKRMVQEKKRLHVEAEAAEQAGDMARAEAIDAEADALAGQISQLRTDAEKRTGVPNAPFKATDEWAMLAFKRMVHHAAVNGFDRIAWTTGEQQAARYDLSKQVDMILVTPRKDATTGEKKRRVAISMTGGNTIVFDADTAGVIGNVSNHNAGLMGKSLDEVVGKEAAQKIMAVEIRHEFTGVDLKVGGDGMRAFYDKILPTAVNKWARKFGGKVERGSIDAAVHPLKVGQDQRGNWVVYSPDDGPRYPVRIATSEADGQAIVRSIQANRLTDQHIIEITPAMRDAALGGLPLFKRAGYEVQVDKDKHGIASGFAP